MRLPALFAKEHDGRRLRLGRVGLLGRSMGGGVVYDVLVSRRILHRYGAPEQNRDPWREVSPRT